MSRTEDILIIEEDGWVMMVVLYDRLESLVWNKGTNAAIGHRCKDESCIERLSKQVKAHVTEIRGEKLATVIPNPIEVTCRGCNATAPKDMDSIMALLGWKR